MIPYFKPCLDQEEIDAVTRVLKSGHLTTGSECDAFEKEFAKAVNGVDLIECLTVSSCTSGLKLALKTLGIGPGDEVIVPTWTFTATAEAVEAVGAKPILADVDELMQLTPDEVSRLTTGMTKAVIPVHYRGHSANVRRIRAVVDDLSNYWGQKIYVIEDAAHSFPSFDDKGSFVGELVYSDAAVFSFYANKTITTGEGGMLCIRKEYGEKARLMRGHGRLPGGDGSWDYDIVTAGEKCNMPDILAAIGRVQLEKAEEMAWRRHMIAIKYQELLPCDWLRPMPWSVDDSLHLYVVELPSPCAKALCVELAETGDIHCSIHWKPLHLHAYWQTDGTFEMADKMHNRLLSLPIFPGMTDDQIEPVVHAIKTSKTLEGKGF